jgi:hypothetical protein
MEITSALTIDASVERVWDLTLDLESWPEMTPTMTRVERLDSGPVVVGSRARVTQPKQRPTVWTVTRCEPRSCFEWTTKVAMVTMTASHHLEPTPDGRCRNTLGVAFSGVGAGLARRLLGGAVRHAIETENQGFRAAAEAHAAA